jgi:hypothetical protein
MDNGLFDTLFRSDYELSIGRQIDASVEYSGGKVVLRRNGDHLGHSWKVLTFITLSVAPIIQYHSVFPNNSFF